MQTELMPEIQVSGIHQYHFIVQEKPSSDHTVHESELTGALRGDVAGDDLGVVLNLYLLDICWKNQILSIASRSWLTVVHFHVSAGWISAWQGQRLDKESGPTHIPALQYVLERFANIVQVQPFFGCTPFPFLFMHQIRNRSTSTMWFLCWHKQRPGCDGISPSEFGNTRRAAQCHQSGGGDVAWGYSLAIPTTQCPDSAYAISGHWHGVQWWTCCNAAYQNRTRTKSRRPRI